MARRFTLPELKTDNMPTISYSILIYAFIALLTLLIYGIIGSTYIMHLGVIDSLYYTVITISTVGYGDISPNTPLQKFFTVTLVMGGGCWFSCLCIYFNNFGG